MENPVQRQPFATVPTGGLSQLGQTPALHIVNAQETFYILFCLFLLFLKKIFILCALTFLPAHIAAAWVLVIEPGSSLEEKSVLVTTKPSLQAQYFVFLIWFNLAEELK